MIPQAELFTRKFASLEDKVYRIAWNKDRTSQVRSLKLGRDLAAFVSLSSKQACARPKRAAGLELWANPSQGPVAQVVERTPDKGEVDRSSRSRPTSFRVQKSDISGQPQGMIAF